MGQSQSYHIVLHLAIGGTSSQTLSGRQLSADVENVKTLKDLKDAAVRAFGALKKDDPKLDYHFYTPDGTEISSDVALQESFAHAHEAFEQLSKCNNSSDPAGDKVAADQQQVDSSGNYMFHMAAVVESSADRQHQGEEAEGTAKGQQQDYQRMEAELPEYGIEDRCITSHDTEVPTTTKCDVLFIGAGPVGLWAAVQLKIRAPHVEIIMLEKYATFQRKHVILLNKRSLLFRPFFGTHTAELTKLVYSFPVGVRTNELEDKLSKFAVSLGIKIIIQPVTDVKAVVEKYDPLCVVGADGSHSVVRKEFMTHGVPRSSSTTTPATAGGFFSKWSEKLFTSAPRPPDLDVDDVVDNTVLLKYEVKENANSLPMSDLYALQKLLPTAFGLFEHVGKPKKVEAKKQHTPQEEEPTGSPSAPVVLIISGVHLDQMKTVAQATFRAPLRPDSTDPDHRKVWLQAHPSIRATVCGFLKAKELIRNEIRDMATVSVAPVPLRVYRAKWFAEMVDTGKPGKRVPAFLVGDSACGCPYFRAANNGFIAGSILATHLADALPKAETVDFVNVENRKKVLGRLHSAVNMYHSFMSLMATKEIMRARGNAALLGGARNMVALQGQNPMQLIKLHHEKEVKEVIEQEVHR